MLDLSIQMFIYLNDSVSIFNCIHVYITFMIIQSMHLNYLVVLNRLVCSCMALALGGCSYDAHNGCGVASVIV